MKKVLVFRMAVVVLLLITLGFGNERLSAGTQGSGGEVTIDNFSFTPTIVTVTAGTTVTWINSDDVPHTIVSDDKIFKSKALDTDEKFSYTFTQPGTYSYFCSVHPKMTAKVVVQ